jgi:hypothetical protein
MEMVPLSGASVAVGSTAGASVADVDASVAACTCVGAGVDAPQAVKSREAAISMDARVNVNFRIFFLQFVLYYIKSIVLVYFCCK